MSVIIVSLVGMFYGLAKGERSLFNFCLGLFIGAAITMAISAIFFQ